MEISLQCLYTFQFAHDQAVIANDRKDMEYMIMEEYDK